MGIVDVAASDSNFDSSEACGAVRKVAVACAQPLDSARNGTKPAPGRHALAPAVNPQVPGSSPGRGAISAWSSAIATTKVGVPGCRSATELGLLAASPTPAIARMGRAPSRRPVRARSSRAFPVVSIHAKKTALGRDRNPRARTRHLLSEEESPTSAKNSLRVPFISVCAAPHTDRRKQLQDYPEERQRVARRVVCDAAQIA